MITLEVAVPLWIEDVRSWTTERRMNRAAICGQHIAEKGDVLQFGGKKGEAAEAFNRLAEGLAILAYWPGGVTFSGVRWEAHDVPRRMLPPPPIRMTARVLPPPPKRRAV